jgi:membrane protease YdiL (CAAX protease family)
MNRSGLLAGFIALLACFWFISKHFGVTIQPATGVSVALLLAPYWAFGFGFDNWLRTHLRGRLTQALTPLLLLAAYLVFALPRGDFQLRLCLGMAAIVVAITFLLQNASVKDPQPDWHDWLALAILAISVELHIFDRAWPIAGLSGMPKLLFVDTALYAYLVIRPIRNIGFDFRLSRSNILIGLREFLYFTPIAVLLGFSLRFLHFHKTLSSPIAFAEGWMFTFVFVAMPEELFFRGLMLNMLERRIGTNRALAITSLLFGLAHFNKRATYFNWRYVILAATAGVFYGRAWLARRSLMASSITHATVDTVWSIWLR